MRISFEESQRTVKAVEDALKRKDANPVSAAALELGIPLSTLKARVGPRNADGGICARLHNLKVNWALAWPLTDEQVKRLAEVGELGTGPVIPGYAIKQTSTQFDAEGKVEREWVQQKKAPGETFEMPAGHRIKGVSALLNAEGRKIAEWVKTAKDQIDPKAFADELAAHFATFEPASIPTPKPEGEFEDLLALYPFADPHFGSLIWGGDASENWDLKIAVRTFKETFAKVAARTPRAQKAVLLLGGDTMHADSNTNMTPRSGNLLQVDGRHPKVFLTACETTVEIAAMLLARHEELEIIVLTGNHDETSANPIAFFLHAWFRNEPRVVVDISAHMFRFRQFGKVMLGFTHGHTAKAKEMHTIMSHYEPETWGRTKHRFAHTFHIHHSSKYVSEAGGCVTESHQVMLPADAYHYSAGYKAGRSQQSIIYDRELGEVGRTRVAIVEDRSEAWPADKMPSTDSAPNMRTA